MRKTWRLKQADSAQVQALADALQVSPVFAQLLVHRGLGTPAEALDFLCPDLGALPEPGLMAGLDGAVRMVREAAASGERAIVVGDYDVDGLTGTALLLWALRAAGLDATWHIPHRMADGYGLREQTIRQAAQAGIRLLITVDCGTTSFPELRLARELGMRTIVVDHHELLPAGPPPADAFLNPLQPACGYPSKELASVGVAFTLVRGLFADRPSAAWEHLDLVALGTVADLSPLCGDNRILVKAGLHRLRGTGKPGLRALLAQTKLDAAPALTAEDVSFCLAPRINAMGRMGSALESLRLLITEDAEEARAIARVMDKENRTRGALEREAFARAIAKVEREVDFSRDRVIVLHDEKWHPGVAGIVATRLAHRFYRPAVVIAPAGPVCRGSARSIRAFPLHEAFELVKEHLVAFGGHAGAAGITIERERVIPFREALNKVARERIDASHLMPCVEVDAELPLASVDAGLMREIEALAPFGMGNPRPVFASRDARVPAEPKPAPFSPMGILFAVEDAAGKLFTAMQPRHDIPEGWNVRRLRGGPLEIAYSPVTRRREDRLEIELRLCDLKVTPAEKSIPA